MHSWAGLLIQWSPLITRVGSCMWGSVLSYVFRGLYPISFLEKGVPQAVSSANSRRYFSGWFSWKGMFEGTAGAQGLVGRPEKQVEAYKSSTPNLETP